MSCKGKYVPIEVDQRLEWFFNHLRCQEAENLCRARRATECCVCEVESRLFTDVLDQIGISKDDGPLLDFGQSRSGCRSSGTSSSGPPPWSRHVPRAMALIQALVSWRVLAGLKLCAQLLQWNQEKQEYICCGILASPSCTMRMELFCGQCWAVRPIPDRR